MAFHQYLCNDCNTEFELQIGLFEGKYILYIHPSIEEEKALWDAGKDPRDSIIEIPLPGLPENPPCTNCGSENTGKLMHETGGWVKGICFTNKERERKFYEKGMDKQQATEFYKQSMEASKERMQTGGTHYKQVVPDMNYMRKTGQVKKVSDKKKKERIDNIAKMNQHIHKAAGIDPLKKP